MNASSQALHQQANRVLALAATRVDPARLEILQQFVPEYFRRLDPDDLAERAPEDLLGAMQSLLELGQQREPGRPKLRIFSPSAGEHGWTSRHSVVQIINDDMPFLVDSTSLEINRQGLNLHLIVHPIYAVERDAKGQLASVVPRGKAPQAARESWMHIEVDRLFDAQQRDALAAGIERVLSDVRLSVQDWQPMLTRLQEVISELQHAPASLPTSAVDENRAFLQWLADAHITLLGYRQHDLIKEAGGPALRPVPGSGLGLLREAGLEQISASFAALPLQARSLAGAPLPMLVVTKSNTRSTVHRAGYTDYIGVKRYSAAGEVIGEHRFIGLFTSTAYSARVSETPLLRGKVQAIATQAGLLPGGHLAKALDHILETFPRDDLFQIPDADLYDTALGILALGERQRLRLFLWQDPFDRFVSCLVYVPRESFSTDLRVKFLRILQQAFNGTGADFDVLLSDTVLARIRVTVRTTPGQVPTFDRKAIERKLAAVARRWDDELRGALVESQGEAMGLALHKRWGGSFPAAYRDEVLALAAVADVIKLAALTPQQPLGLTLYQPDPAMPGALGLKVYRLGQPLVLSDSLPMLEHMGARVLAESGWRIGTADDPQTIALHDFQLEAAVTTDAPASALAALFEDAFARVMRGEVESDDFNRLVLRAGLAADDVVVLRAYAKYLKQIGFAQSQATIAATLCANPRIAHMLCGLFKLRLDPQAHDAVAAASQVRAIEQALDEVSNLSEDLVLRQLLALIQATLRTNFWRTGVGNSGAAGPRRSFLSLKLDSAKVPGLPQPRPLYEIFVYSPRFEGIHLRGGKVARGGLRWSDRPDDFRTEVLGLVKAQMVKNTVIVPVGSKGGFVLKKAPSASDREAFLKEGVACYQDYLRGLLDLTDNLVAGKPVAPPHVVRMDADDPYLVVAADKGTASFSDYANQISLEYGHWLGDAFASGGSVGYDHKAMGITARGAWESVKRHFREMGIDTQTADFTVAGIGDMSGDVFGNGMLLSPHICLVAAFDHRHVFIDPRPDTQASFKERQRLFALPRSSWADYEASIISAGGGVWSRSEKSIPISEQARSVLGIDAEHLAPSELVSAILRAPVDLLYNGGIGTYVKASSESASDVGDRANDALRINGNELRCKVVGEGGNLGFTQRGRIEAAVAGVRLYTDAIDNSAGVDTSDHEVNIKILMGMAIDEGRLSLAQRNGVLPSMTDEVASLVLRDNYFQTQALSVGRRIAATALDEQARFIRFLEKKGRLDRAIEFLPTEEEIGYRKTRGQGLTTPEQAVVLAYSKMWLSDELMASDLLEDPWVATALHRYFPAALHAQFSEYIPRHPLRREIIATHVLNSMVNRVGPTFAHRFVELAGVTPAQVVRAYLLAREVFGSVELWHEIESLDNRVSDAVQFELIAQWRLLMTRACAWFLRYRRVNEPMGQLVQRFAPAVALLRSHAQNRESDSPQLSAWLAAGVPAELAWQVAGAQQIFNALDVAEVAQVTNTDLQTTAEIHIAVAQQLQVDKLREGVDQLPEANHWQSLAKGAVSDDLLEVQRSITQDVAAKSEGPAQSRLAQWQQHNAATLHRSENILAELRETSTPDLAVLAAVLRELRKLG